MVSGEEEIDKRIERYADEAFLAFKERGGFAHALLIRATEERLLDHLERAGAEPPPFTHDRRKRTEQLLLATVPSHRERIVFQHECRLIQRRLSLPQPYALPFMEKDDFASVAPSFQPVLDAVFRRLLRRQSHRDRNRRAAWQNRLWPARWALEEALERRLTSPKVAATFPDFFRTVDVREGFRLLFPPRVQHEMLRSAEARFEENGVEHVALIRPADPPEVPPVLTDEAAILLDDLRFEALRRPAFLLGAKSRRAA